MRGPPARIHRQHRRVVAAGAVAHHKYLVAIAAMFGDVRMPSHRREAAFAPSGRRPLPSSKSGAILFSNNSYFYEIGDIMADFIEIETHGQTGLLRLNRPEKLNAWHKPMRDEIMAALKDFDANESIRAIIMTGAGDRAFCAGQDLAEAHGFDVTASEAWMHEWEAYYETLRSLSKPIIMALNGVAAGSAFQVALLGDIRIGHPGVRMGQPEINSGIASVTGPWIMQSMIGMSRTIELTLTGRMMEAEECHRIGLMHHLVPADQVLPKALEIAALLAGKPPVAMRLDKQRFREMTQAGFEEAIQAGIRIQGESYASGEPARMMEAFFRARGHTVPK
jgi:enoyl-CoA hydratase/carnithine racemase